ncbi:acyl carrier protein [Fusibacter tunisiensis]|jgi:acyl carrier protein|uniref:Acyl carrier protein n=1 Tax=Fusibacter tunisiensis TaxID=1008308 RepID=A0ABS2MRG2_9FIRM|nr:acyl carrier protein [Fusibacter tunisiensis]MBM7562003.1 acyl carrier protein [Fusibacter tunisiensis]
MSFEKVKALLVDELDLDENEVTLESGLKEDLGADSLDMVDLIMSIEDTFEIKVDESDASTIKTVGDIVKYIENKAS